MNTIPANELKIKGITAIDHHFDGDNQESIITHRGKPKYVVIPIDAYNQLREMQLLLAIEECKKAVAEGQYIVESVDQHIKRVKP